MLVFSRAMVGTQIGERSVGKEERRIPPDGCAEAVEQTEDMEADDGFHEGARDALRRRSLSLEGHVAAGFRARSAQERLESRDGVHLCEGSRARAVHEVAWM